MKVKGLYKIKINITPIDHVSVLSALSTSPVGGFQEVGVFTLAAFVEIVAFGAVTGACALAITLKVEARGADFTFCCC